MLKTTPFDAADYLTTPQARAEYMTAAFETGDLEFIRDSLGVVVKAIGVAKVSQQIGLTREGLYKSLGKSGNPEFATIMRIVRALGLTLSAKPAAVERKGKKRKVA
jgi:probable addiction module antidote protein